MVRSLVAARGGGRVVFRPRLEGYREQRGNQDQGQKAGTNRRRERPFTKVKLQIDQKRPDQADLAFADKARDQILTRRRNENQCATGPGPGARRRPHAPPKCLPGGAPRSIAAGTKFGSIRSSARTTGNSKKGKYVGIITSTTVGRWPPQDTGRRLSQP